REQVIWHFGPEEVQIRQAGREERATYTLDESTRPPSITITYAAGMETGPAVPGIYERDGDRLTICLGEPGGRRPDAFTSEPGAGVGATRVAAPPGGGLTVFVISGGPHGGH